MGYYEWMLYKDKTLNWDSMTFEQHVLYIIGIVCLFLFAYIAGRLINRCEYKERKW